MRTRLRRFLSEEFGTITTDWVVLTAALLGTGWAVLSTVQDGVEHASVQTAGQLRGSIVSASFGSELCRGGVDALQEREDFRAEHGGGDRIDVGRWLDANGAELTDGALMAEHARLSADLPDLGWTRASTLVATMECAMVIRGLD
ncbi:hypothetical protein [Jannaschia ovalis]|uniref:Uncharacterized protein n=1 Tax=Jannaschia ovalis TaxID=3038773 RepID=A0ABY8LEN3_9RHOB|nr:hypothetical protein [Jannaschia sp. GRR-S6-38]WGH79781.1 hypothetical protein P8627_05830 [Jannaschia sp. GRR-S6-38]